MSEVPGVIIWQGNNSVLLWLSSVVQTLSNRPRPYCLLQMLQFNRGAVLKGLLTLLVTPPSIPARHRTVCCRMLEDFREFGSVGWTNLPEAEVSNAACDGGRDIHISR
jgi:hypothetical protein